MTFLFSLAWIALATDKPDTCSILYWYGRLDEIGMYEQMRIDNVERIAREENQHAARDFADDISRRIRAIQKKIEKDNEEGK